MSAVDPSDRALTKRALAPADSALVPGRTLGAWQVVGTTVACVRDHTEVSGHLDETARRLSHQELAAAQQLASEGHDVRSLAERRNHTRTPDLLVCGTPVEVKSWLGRDERGGVEPGTRSVVNKLLQAEGQASTVVLNGRGSGLSASSARAGVADYARLERSGGLVAVRVLGDGFDLGWSCDRSVRRERTTEPATARGRTPDLEPAGPDLGAGL